MQNIKNSLYIIFWSIFIISLSPQVLLANTSCIQSKIIKGRVVNKVIKAKAGSKCPKGTVAIFSAALNPGVAGNDGEMGLQGVTGPQGPAGTNGVNGSTGPQGPIGPQGPQGTQGIQGIMGSSGISVATGNSINNSASPKSATATCPNGTELFGGWRSVSDGFFGPVNNVALSLQTPLFNETFKAQAFETTAVADNWVVTAFALCRTK